MDEKSLKRQYLELRFNLSAILCFTSRSVHTYTIIYSVRVNIIPYGAPIRSLLTTTLELSFFVLTHFHLF